jgi:hypothetical protein
MAQIPTIAIPIKNHPDRLLSTAGGAGIMGHGFDAVAAVSALVAIIKLPAVAMMIVTA